MVEICTENKSYQKGMGAAPLYHPFLFQKDKFKDNTDFKDFP